MSDAGSKRFKLPHLICRFVSPFYPGLSHTSRAYVAPVAYLIEKKSLLLIPNPTWISSLKPLKSLATLAWDELEERIAQRLVSCGASSC